MVNDNKFRRQNGDYDDLKIMIIIVCKHFPGIIRTKLNGTFSLVHVA